MIFFTVVPPNFRTLCIISAASFSNSPSFLPIVTIVSSSVSERVVSSFDPRIFSINWDILSNIHTNGAKIIDSISIGRAAIRETFSAFCDANVFGVISPKIRTRNVITPVAIPIPLEPKRFVKITVASDAAPILARLFPIRSVMINLWGFSFSLYRTAAPFLLCLTRAFAFIWFIETMAVSIPENRADRNSSTIRIVI